MACYSIPPSWSTCTIACGVSDGRATSDQGATKYATGLPEGQFEQAGNKPPSGELPPGCAGSSTARTAPAKRLLRDEGYSVMELDSATAALEYLHRSAPPQLIVLDLMMPEMDGWDFRMKQKGDEKLASIPVIAVSAAGKLMDVDISFRKPLDHKEFLRAVKQYVG